MQRHQLAGILNILQTGLADPEYQAFRQMAPEKRTFAYPPDKLFRFFEISDLEKQYPADKLAKMAADIVAAERRDREDEREHALSLCRRPASRQATEFYRRALDHEYFGRWKNSYLKVMPEAADYVKKVLKERPALPAFPFPHDESLPEVHRNYPEGRKSRVSAVENRRKVFDYVAVNRNATDEEIAEVCDVSASGASKILKSLRDEGYIHTTTARSHGTVTSHGNKRWINTRTISILKPLLDTLYDGRGLEHGLSKN